ncbi:MAG TPA: hypothetical protein VFS08_15255 [Gemmatimonadaceae bacterium]|nr:hypothetical protein [Gemmatimonadaceae bacterium]
MATPPPAVARSHRPLAGRLSRRSLLRTLAVLGAAALLLALVVRSPRSVPLLLGVGVSAVLALRLLAAPPRGIAHAAVVPVRAASLRADPGRTERSRNGGRLDWSPDVVHDAALDSFPASDPPSWSPLRVGAPASSEPRIAAPA